MPTDFDKRLCCAAGICCEDGSPEQLAALTAILGGDEKSASNVLRLFKISDRSGRTKPEDFAA